MEQEPQPRRSIEVLPDALIDQIAAGEVVERPASVVRELLDNAVDAGARRIELELRKGGVEWLSLRDDGHGIPPEQLRLALQRHATSKIRSAEELLGVRTLGFRGEALPSIASVCRFAMTSRPADALAGSRIAVEGGREVGFSEVGAPPGTCVEVEDLFYNVPARRKFLRAERTESAHVLDVVQRLALVRTDIHLLLREDGREVLNLPPAAGLAERLADIFGKAVGPRLYPLDRRGSKVRVHGFLSPPDLHRSNSSGLYFFVNGRPVRDRNLVGAVRGGFRGMLPPGRHPFGVVFLELDPAEVDVNVHPQKAEVRFREAGAVTGSLVVALREFLATAPWVAATPLAAPAPAGLRSGAAVSVPVSLPRGGVGSLGRDDPGAVQLLFPAAALSAAEQRGAYGLAPAAEPSGPPPPSPSPGAADPPAHSVATSSADAAEAARWPEAGGYFSRLRLLGQVGDSYLVCEGPDGLVFIDQHAAHERVTYERIRAAYEAGQVPRQALLFPLRLELDLQSRRALEANAGLFEDLGFELEPFGGDTVVLKALPAEVAEADPLSLIDELVEQLGPQDTWGSRAAASGLQQRQEELWATMACHGSVRAGQSLSLQEQRALLRALDRVDFRGNCPHGRPVSSELSFRDLEQRMKRR